MNYFVISYDNAVVLHFNTPTFKMYMKFTENIKNKK